MKHPSGIQTFDHLLYRLEENIGYITINRESKMNALNAATLKELNSLLLYLKEDANCWGIILTGSGNKAFVAGADISEFTGKSPTEGRALSEWGHTHVFNLIANFPKPIIAAINGYALGGGLELAMACHLRIATEHSQMGLPEVSLGIIPGYGGTQRLPQLVGKAKAMQMILTGDMISASDALTWQLVNDVVPAETLLSRSAEILKRMFLRSRKALAAAIEAVNASFDKEAEGYQLEIDRFGALFGTDDFIEGTLAFLEKRKPQF